LTFLTFNCTHCILWQLRFVKLSLIKIYLSSSIGGEAVKFDYMEYCSPLIAGERGSCKTPHRQYIQMILHYAVNVSRTRKYDDCVCWSTLSAYISVTISIIAITIGHTCTDCAATLFWDGQSQIWGQTAVLQMGWILLAVSNLSLRDVVRGCLNSLSLKISTWKCSMQLEISCAPGVLLHLFSLLSVVDNVSLYEQNVKSKRRLESLLKYLNLLKLFRGFANCDCCLNRHFSIFLHFLQAIWLRLEDWKHKIGIISGIYACLEARSTGNIIFDQPLLIYTANYTLMKELNNV